MFKKSALILSALIMLTSCAQKSSLKFAYLTDTEIAGAIRDYAPVYPEVRFAIFTDTHVYDTDLGTTGAAMSNYLANDRKLLLESEEILDTQLSKIIAEKPEFVIVCGDMTKDGEKQDHELVAARLAKLEAAGIPVFVVPGNHDILNYHANRFEDDNMIRVPTVDETEFTNIYADYGYDEAIERDPDSLCYVAEPVEGLWLLCLDSTVHITNENLEESQIGGGFEQTKLDWIEKILAKAVRENKAVFVVEHHGINPHWDGQQKLHPDYLVKDYEAISKMFAAYKVRAAFTGHYHSQDISFADWGNNNFIFDIETGSFVTYPCPYRVVTINEGNQMTVESRFLESIPSIREGFTDYAREFMESGVRGIAVKKIVEFGAPYDQAVTIGDMVAEAYAAHYAGDENPAGIRIGDPTGLGFKGKLVLMNQRYVLEGLWHDSPAPDVTLTIDLNIGKW